MSSGASTTPFPNLVASVATAGTTFNTPGPGVVVKSRVVNLGETRTWGAQGEDTVLAYVVTATGADADKSIYGTGPDAAATDSDLTAVQLLANAGCYAAIYCETTEAIARGEIVELDPTAAGQFKVRKATSAGKAVGVAPCNVPSGGGAWFWKKGLVSVLSAGAFNAGDSLTAATGKADAIGTATDVSFGRAFEEATGADEIVLAQIDL